MSQSARELLDRPHAIAARDGQCVMSYELIDDILCALVRRDDDRDRDLRLVTAERDQRARLHEDVLRANKVLADAVSRLKADLRAAPQVAAAVALAEDMAHGACAHVREYVHAYRAACAQDSQAVTGPRAPATQGAGSSLGGPTTLGPDCGGRNGGRLLGHLGKGQYIDGPSHGEEGGARVRGPAGLDEITHLPSGALSFIRYWTKQDAAANPSHSMCRTCATPDVDCGGRSALPTGHIGADEEWGTKERPTVGWSKADEAANPKHRMCSTCETRAILKARALADVPEGQEPPLQRPPMRPLPMGWPPAKRECWVHVAGPDMKEGDRVRWISPSTRSDDDGSVPIILTACEAKRIYGNDGKWWDREGRDGHWERLIADPAPERPNRRGVEPPSLADRVKSLEERLAETERFTLRWAPIASDKLEVGMTVRAVNHPEPGDDDGGRYTPFVIGKLTDAVVIAEGATYSDRWDRRMRSWERLGPLATKNQEPKANE